MSTIGHSVSQLLPEVAKVEEPPTVSGARFDLEEILSIEAIRAHTKTLDVPTVLNTQLELYRKAAFEAAEQYTGLLLTRVRQVEEDVSKPQTMRPRRTVRHRLQYPTSDGIVHLYGARDGIGNRTIRVSPGARDIQVPVVHEVLDYWSCCTGSDPSGTNYGMRVIYRAGYADVKDIPSGVLLGVLRYIAWSVENPGDILMSVQNKIASNTGGLQGTNNVPWASGALEMWHQYAGDP